MLVSLDKKPETELVLASASPRRRELLESAGLRFSVLTAEVDELMDGSLSPEKLCMHNALAKAEEVAAMLPSACVIGADTLVFIDNSPLGKPADIEEARRTLRKLSGKTHFVCTGVAIVSPKGVKSFCELTEVTFRKLEEKTIELYLEKVNVMDKAGSYACQEYGDLIISSLRGDRNNVIGLPLARTLQELKDFL